MKKYKAVDPTSFWKIFRQLKNSDKKLEMAQEVHFTINSKAVLAETNGEKAKCCVNDLGATMQAKLYPEMGLPSIKTGHWDDEIIVDCGELDSKLKTKRNTARRRQHHLGTNQTKYCRTWSYYLCTFDLKP